MAFGSSPFHLTGQQWYSVMIKSPHNDRLRQQIGTIPSRPFALGATSFMLTGNEAISLIKHGHSA